MTSALASHTTSRCVATSFKVTRPGSSGASKSTISAWGSASEPPPSTMVQAKTTPSSTCLPARSRQTARSVRLEPTCTTEDAGDMRTLYSGPAISKKDCVGADSLSGSGRSPAVASPGTLVGSKAGPVEASVRRPGALRCTSNQSYSSAGKANSASRNARRIDFSVRSLARSSSARLRSPINASS